MPANKSYYLTLLTNPNVRAFLLMIRNGEGTLGDIGYRTMFTHKTFNDFSRHPNIKHTAGSLTSTAAGAYQFLFDTWEEVRKQLKLPDFTPINQDVGGVHLIYRRGALQSVINGDIINAIRKCNREWASLPESPYGQPTVTMNKALAFYTANGGRLSRFDDEQFNQMKSYGTGYVAQSVETPSATINSNGTGQTNNPFIQSLDFTNLYQNIESQELDDTDASWGNRTSPLEESDYIGLKQYIIYLITRYYPQSLIPFVELIPNFEVDFLNPVESLSSEQVEALKFTAKSTGLDYSGVTNAIEESVSQDRIIDAQRYERTRKKLKELQDQGGADLANYDPFEEFSESFNVPNEAGKNINSKRGLSYKIYGSLVLNPAAEQDGLSKPGAVGLTNITIEQGAQSQNGMTMITVKLLDVQGNKFLDINSPWSFLLNQRANDGGGDFLFRYGWQIRIPKYNSNNDYKNDPQAGKFWNHVGWANLFFARSGENGDNWDKGNTIKKYISSLAEKSDYTLTFTQSVSKESMSNPGYESLKDKDTGKVSYRVKRDLNFFDYYSLTLITPDININPKDGSVEATLVFRTKEAVGNCLCPLHLGDEIRSLVSSTSTTNLANLMKAFVNDNYKFAIRTPTNNLSKNKRLFYSNNKNVSDWVTVIGGIGKDNQLFLNPEDIKVTISTDKKDEIINATFKDTRLLIQWLNEVLNNNDMALLTAADKGSAPEGVQSSLDQGFVIVYDNDKAESLNGTTKTNEELAKKDITFGDFLKMNEFDTSNDNFIGKRLLTQDDVFSFRFQGSLVEEINIEKLNAPNEATMAANKQFADSQLTIGDDKDVEQKTEKTTDENSNPLPPTSKVTIHDKKRNLNYLYSQLLGLKVTAICHPWLKVARPCYVKGMGFFDGKYTILKISHNLGADGRFTSSINATRIPDTNMVKDKERKKSVEQNVAINNPGVYKAEQYTGKVPTGTAIKAKAPINSLPASILNPLPTGLIQVSGIVSSLTPVPLLRDSLEFFINELHRSYKNHFRAFINEFETKYPQYRVLITSGYRSFAKQAGLKRQNANNARPGYSMHNYGLAIDINIVSASNPNTIIARMNSADSVWRDTGILSIANKYGLTWGGTFNNYSDRVHFGLDKTFDSGMLLELAKRQFGADVNNIIGNRLDFGFGF